MKFLLVPLLSVGLTSTTFAETLAFFPAPSRGSRTSRKLVEPFRSAWIEVLQSQFPDWTWDLDSEGKAPSRARRGSTVEALSSERPGTKVFSVCLEEARRREGPSELLLSSLLKRQGGSKKRPRKHVGSHVVRLRVAVDGLVRYDERHRSESKGYSAPNDKALATQAGRRSALHLLEHWAQSEGIPWRPAPPPATATTKGHFLKLLDPKWGVGPAAKPPVTTTPKPGRRSPR